MSNEIALGIITQLLLTGACILLLMKAITGHMPVLATLLAVAAVGTATAQALHTDQ